MSSIGWMLCAALMCTHSFQTFRLLHMCTTAIFTTGCVLRIYFARMERCPWRLHGWVLSCFALAGAMIACLVYGGPRAHNMMRPMVGGQNYSGDKLEQYALMILAHTGFFLVIIAVTWIDRATPDATIKPRSRERVPAHTTSPAPTPLCELAASAAVLNFEQKSFMTVAVLGTTTYTGLPSPDLDLNVSILTALLGATIGWVAVQAFESRLRESFLFGTVTREMMLVWRAAAIDGGPIPSDDDSSAVANRPASLSTTW